MATRQKALSAVTAQLSEDLQQLRDEVLEGFVIESDSEDEPGLDGDTDGEVVAGTLTKGAVLAASGEACLEDVTQLVIRDKGLSNLAAPRSVDFTQLTSLEVLSLSHNSLVDISPLSALESLLEVNINFNQIKDLSPLFECDLLEKLFASHNKVSSVKGLAVGCPRLRVLSLFANALESDRAADELVTTLRDLPDLRSLDIGQNACCSKPSQRYGLILALPALEHLDGQQLTRADRIFAAEFQEGAAAAAASSNAPQSPPKKQAPGGTSCSLGASPSEQKLRPGTAPPVVSTGGRGFRPPLLPQGSSGALNGAVPVLKFATLPGQRLRSSQSNRMDEVLTSSREPSPEEKDGPSALAGDQLDMRDPQAALRAIVAHAEMLKRQLDVVQIDRDNLRFEVNLLQRDRREALPERFVERAKELEVENQSLASVESENKQLTARLAEVRRALASLPELAKSASSSAPSGPAAAAAAAGEDDGGGMVGSRGANATEEDEDVLSALRWENELLEKRLKRLKGYTDGLREDAVRKYLTSSCGSGSVSVADGTGADVPVLERLLSDNEANLQKLRTEVRDTATAIARRDKLQPPPRGGQRPESADPEGKIDILTISENGADQEAWQS